VPTHANFIIIARCLLLIIAKIYMLSLNGNTTVQVSGQLEGIEEILESQLNIKKQILDNVDDKLYVDGVQRIEAVFIAFLKSKFIFIKYIKLTM
jgi:hypothetical protein